MIVNKLLMRGSLIPVTTANVTGETKKFVNSDSQTFHIVAADTPSMTVVIERSVDGTNFVQVSSTAISANGTTEVLVKGEPCEFYRAVVSSYVSGEVSVLFNAA